MGAPLQPEPLFVASISLTHDSVRYGDLEKLLLHQWTVQAHPFSRQIADEQQLYCSQEEDVCWRERRLIACTDR